MFRLQFDTLVDAPLTVAFDVARHLGRPWPFPLEEVESRRPLHDVHAVGPGHGWRVLRHARSFSPTAAGTLVHEQVDGAVRLPPPLGRLVEEGLLRRRVRRSMQAHLDGYAAAAQRRGIDVVRVVGAAVLADGRVLAAQRRGGEFDGRWEFPGGKVERGETELEALVRECQEELGVRVVPRSFLGEVVLDVAFGGAPRGSSTMRVWAAGLAVGEPVAREHAALRWVAAQELETLDWIPADRPLLPAVRALLAPSLR